MHVELHPISARSVADLPLIKLNLHNGAAFRSQGEYEYLASNTFGWGCYGQDQFQNAIRAFGFSMQRQANLN